MDPQIIFVTVFLGIVAGPHPVDLQVTGAVKAVRLLLGEREVARIAAPPWHADVDFSTDLAPRELVAVGYDADGHEIARAAQVLNLPRPLAELEIVVDGDDVVVHARHLMDIKPARVSLRLDGKPLALHDLHAKLPKLNREVPHVIAAEVGFGDGYTARRELVVESLKSIATGTELTPILVRETGERHPASWDGCMARPDGSAVRTAAVESADAVVVVVRAPDLREVASIFNPVLQELSKGAAERRLPEMLLAGGTVERILWPIGEKYGTNRNSSFLFVPSMDYDASTTDFTEFLMSAGPDTDPGQPLRFADAVAVAGIRAVTGAQRRAVVLLLSYQPDASTHAPQAVRRYLDALGVPLFVWSPMSPKPKSAAGWGEVEDVSTIRGLGNAVGRLRRALAAQRIAWVGAGPLEALQLQANAKCGIETVARLP